MKHTATDIAALILKKISDQITDAEALILEDWKNASAANQQQYEELLQLQILQEELKQYRAAQKIGQQVAVPDVEASTAASSPVRLRRVVWLRWVAAAILILAIGSGVYYFSNQSPESIAIIGGTGETSGTMGDVAPGTDRAVLTLSDGTQKELSLADNGLQLQSDAVLLTTPKGGRYQAVLPDGSKVWLNAASSIKFPSKFNKERKVEVTGEVYFEIAKDAKRPFKVSGGGQEIDVLGTSFNINIYDDEPIKKTTLLTGSIKITNNNQTAILQPGQQANISSLEILPIRLIQVQTSDAIAWTSNLFFFKNIPLKEIMRQLKRWYDIEVIYKDEIDIPLVSTMPRDLPLSAVLKALEQTGVATFRIEGNKVSISKQKNKP